MKVRVTWVLSLQTLFSRENASESMQTFEKMFWNTREEDKLDYRIKWSEKGGQKKTPPPTRKPKINGTEKIKRVKS